MSDIKRLSISIVPDRMSGERRILAFRETVGQYRRHLQEKGFTSGFLAAEGLGSRIGLNDRYWRGEALVVSRETAFTHGDIIIHVKQPDAEDVKNGFYRPGQVSLCFQHPSANAEVALQLLKKGVKLVAMENHRPILQEMSYLAGDRLPDVLERCYHGDWRKKKFFFLGARGALCRRGINAILWAGVHPDNIFCCDIQGGIFTASDTTPQRTYETFSISNTRKLEEALRLCDIFNFAALKSDGKAPQPIELSHLELMSDGAFLTQPSIDNKGNIADPAFQKVTSWSNPTYTVSIGGKKFTVCNLPNLPGCIRPMESSMALVRVTFDFFCQIFEGYPGAIPEEYLVTEEDSK